MEDIISGLTQEEQIEFMIEHLKKEKEAEERQAQFDAITPQDGDNFGLPPPQQPDGSTVVASETAEVAEEWDEYEDKSWMKSEDYYEEVVEDIEDTMSEEEWLAYYEENVAQTDADSQDIGELEYMREQLEEGEEIDELSLE